MKKAMELEPLSLIQGANYAGVLLYARRFDEAITAYETRFGVITADELVAQRRADRASAAIVPSAATRRAAGRRRRSSGRA